MITWEQFSFDIRECISCNAQAFDKGSDGFSPKSISWFSPGLNLKLSNCSSAVGTTLIALGRSSN